MSALDLAEGAARTWRDPNARIDYQAGRSKEGGVCRNPH